MIGVVSDTNMHHHRMFTRGSVIAAASSLAAKYGAGEGGGSDDILYALVNNAAIGFGNSLRDTLNTNFYGPKRVSDAFLPLIDRTVGRVVNLGSGSAPMYITKLDPSKRKLFTDPTATWSDLEDRIKEVAASNEEGVNYYGFSKALLNSYTVQLSQAHPHLCINSCTPGFILTDLTRAFGAVNPPETGDLLLHPPFVYLSRSIVYLQLSIIYKHPLSTSIHHLPTSTLFRLCMCGVTLRFHYCLTLYYSHPCLPA